MDKFYVLPMKAERMMQLLSSEHKRNHPYHFMLVGWSVVYTWGVL